MREKLVFFWGLTAIVLLGAFSALSAPAFAPKGIEQPIRFNHQKHVKFGLACANCHQNVTEGAVAGIPQAQFCMTCHQAPVTTNPEAAKIKEYYEAGKEIPWVRLFDLGNFAVFSHRPHIKAQVECTTCHGNIPEQDVIPVGFGRDSITRAKGWTLPVGWTIRPLVDLTWRGPIGTYGMPLMNDLCMECHKKVEKDKQLTVNHLSEEAEGDPSEKRWGRRITDCLTCHN